MSVSRFTVASRVDAYSKAYFAGRVPDGDLPQQVDDEEVELMPTHPEHRPPAQFAHHARPTWYTGRDRNNPNQDFRKS